MSNENVCVHVLDQTFICVSDTFCIIRPWIILMLSFSLFLTVHHHISLSLLSARDVNIDIASPLPSPPRHPPLIQLSTAQLATCTLEYQATSAQAPTGSYSYQYALHRRIKPIALSVQPCEPITAPASLRGSLKGICVDGSCS